MGIFLNPGNSEFTTIRNDTYVDKSGLVTCMNKVLDTPRKLMCVSRPRRFGKSFAASMLCAYYDCGCDSSALFADLQAANDEESREAYGRHLNAHNVIYLDMTGIIGEGGKDAIVSYTRHNLMRELAEAYPFTAECESLLPALDLVVEQTGAKFVAIIDEWDAPIRETMRMPDVQREYLEFLRSLFKNSSATGKIFSGAYMTGILPIKKDGSQSAISNFREYSMLAPGSLAPYVGFTEDEVQGLCEELDGDFQQAKSWYDGYTLPGAESVYNPNSVMCALQSGRYASYWAQTSAASSLLAYVSMDFEGLGKTCVELLAGNEVEVETGGFENDFETFNSADDVLTLMIHLGYLTYDADAGTARIPNEEVRLEFARTVRNDSRADTVQRVRESDQLIEDTVALRADAVAAQLEKIHEEECHPLFYNGEQALRGVIKLAYFCYKDQYVQMEELPGGAGFADVVYLPKKRSPYPALVVELKCDEGAEGAIAQIRRRNYPKALEGYGGDVLLVGVSYDKDAEPGQRTHHCSIERL